MNVQQIKGQWNEFRNKVKEKWESLTEDDLECADGNVDSVIGRIQRRTGETREAIERYFDQLAGNSAGFGHRAAHAMETIREGVTHAGERIDEEYRRGRELVERRPVSSLAVVFAGGVAAGLIVGLVMHAK